MPRRPPYGPPEPFPCLRFGENLWRVITTVTASTLTLAGQATGLKAAKFRDDHLTHITFWWDLPEPALVQVIDCLGPPDYYTASYSTATQGQSIWINLWYVERGFYVSGGSTTEMAATTAARFSSLDRSTSAVNAVVIVERRLYH